MSPFLFGLLFVGFAVFDIWAYRNYEDSRLARGYGRALFWWSSDPQSWLMASSVAFSLVALGAFLGLIP
jgi:hypothetical protein